MQWAALLPLVKTHQMGSRNPSRGGGGSGFQVTGMIEGFSWFKWEFLGAFKSNVSPVLFFVQYNLILSENFYGSEIRHGIFLVINVGPGSFGGFVGSAWDFFGFWFLPPFDHPCHFIEIQCTPTKTEAGVTACNDFGFLYARHVWLFRAFFLYLHV